MADERVQKIISNAGYCSRRKAEKLIEDGLVEVNRKTITIGDKADPDKDKIKVEGKVLNTANKKIYLMMNKPRGLLTTVTDPQERKTVMSLLKDVKDRVYPVGRLDGQSSGLLLFTNDGEFANRLMHPRYNKDKIYIVRIDRPLRAKDKRAIEEGVELEEYTTSPCEIEMINQVQFGIVLHEGRNRQIRKMMDHFGYKVSIIHRVAIGDLELDLDEGEYRHLTKDEVRMFMKE